MPNYDYQCECCKHIEERFFKISERQDQICCTKCRGVMFKKVTSPAIPSIVGKWEFEKNNEWSKNELDTELKEHDKFRRAEEKDTEAAIKSGEFVEKMSDI